MLQKMAAITHNNGRIVLYADSSTKKPIGGLRPSDRPILDYEISYVEFCCEVIDADFIDWLQVAGAVPIPKPQDPNTLNSDLGRLYLEEQIRNGWEPALLPFVEDRVVLRPVPTPYHRFIHFFASGCERGQSGELNDHVHEDVNVAATASGPTDVWGTMESFPIGAICRLYKDDNLPERKPLPKSRKQNDNLLEWTLKLDHLQRDLQRSCCGENDTAEIHAGVPICSSLLPGRRNFHIVRRGKVAKGYSIRSLFVDACMEYRGRYTTRDIESAVFRTIFIMLIVTIA